MSSLVMLKFMRFALRVCFTSLLYEFALRICFADLLCEFASRICFADLLCEFALSLLLNYKETNHFYILSSKNRTYRNIVMKLRFDIKLLDFIKRNNILITYTYYHSDSKATPCGFSKVRR